MINKRVLLTSVGVLPQYTAKGGQFIPRLGLFSIAAVTPSDWDVQVLADVREEQVPLDEPYGVVGMSVLTPHAYASYRVADEFRKRGVKVVMGGPHAACMPEEALLHADAVVTGEGDGVWAQILRDAEKGQLKGIYQPNPIELNQLPSPRYDLVDTTRYTAPAIINLERGCKFRCRWCLVPTNLQGRTVTTKNADRAVEEVRWMKDNWGVNHFAVVDCSVNLSDYMVSFADAVKPLNMTWTGAAVLAALKDAKALERLAAGGCNCIYIETGALAKAESPNRFKSMVETIRIARSLGIKCWYNFELGYEHHDETIFQDTIEFIESTHMELYIFQIFTPWPGGPQFKKIDAEGRMLTKDWDRYNNAYAVHQPARMTVGQLEGGYAKLYEHFYSGSFFECLPLANVRSFKRFASFFV